MYKLILATVYASNGPSEQVLNMYIKAQLCMRRSAKCFDQSRTSQLLILKFDWLWQHSGNAYVGLEVFSQLSFDVMGVKVSTKWRIYTETHVFVLSCKFLTCKHKNLRVSMYFLHLVLTATPHYIILVKVY